MINIAPSTRIFIYLFILHTVKRGKNSSVAGLNGKTLAALQIHKRAFG